MGSRNDSPVQVSASLRGSSVDWVSNTQETAFSRHRIQPGDQGLEPAVLEEGHMAGQYLMC